MSAVKCPGCGWCGEYDDTETDDFEMDGDGVISGGSVGNCPQCGTVTEDDFGSIVTCPACTEKVLSDDLFSPGWDSEHDDEFRVCYSCGVVSPEADFS